MNWFICLIHLSPGHQCLLFYLVKPPLLDLQDTSAWPDFYWFNWSNGRKTRLLGAFRHPFAESEPTKKSSAVKLYWAIQNMPWRPFWRLSGFHCKFIHIVIYFSLLGTRRPRAELCAVCVFGSVGQLYLLPWLRLLPGVSGYTMLWRGMVKSRWLR